LGWSAQIDDYCERVDFSFWAEPVNAVTNLAFLLAAVVLWRRLEGQTLPLAKALTIILALIGIGSFLFHTFATRWASVTDGVPILIFILMYIYGANLVFWRLKPWQAIIVTAFFVPYAAATVPLFDRLGFLGSSAGYAPVPLLIYLYAFLLRHRLPEVARGLAIGASILVASLVFRTVDAPLCAGVPLGTHFMWHVLNAVMLAWMIDVYRRHALHPAKNGATS